MDRLLAIPTEAQIAYIAGFFDGEGCVGIRKPCMDKSRGRLKTHSPYVTISQVHRDVLDMIRGFYGGNIYFSKNGGKNGIWTYQQGGTNLGFDFLRAIYPYLIVKKEQVRVILEAFEELVSIKKAGTPDYLVQRREAARLELTRLKGLHLARI